MLYRIISKTFVLTFLGGLIAVSCGPVHSFTKAMKTPKEYSLNYYGRETDLSKQVWIVYSDRDKNQTFNTAGGRVKAKDVDYLDPFLVIGTTGDNEYLELVKYTPTALKNGKFNHKEAEYYGWMHRSKLLLNGQSVTDASSGRKTKMLTVLADVQPVNDPDKFLTTDSVKLHKDPELRSPNGALPIYSIVYPLKSSDDNTMTLVAKKSQIKPEEAKKEILGWIDNSLIMDIGSGLHVNTETIPNNTAKFRVQGSEISITEAISNANKMLSEQYKTIQYNPVLSYSTRDTLVAFKTHLVLPIFDYNDNYIFNLNGEQISRRSYETIDKDLRKINISFVFDGIEQTIEQFPQVVNALQNLQPMFEQSDGYYSYLFNCVMAFDETDGLSQPLSTEFTPDYAKLVSFLSDKANKKSALKPTAASRQSWQALRKSVEGFDRYRDATNLIVLIGDKRIIGSSSIDQALIDRISENNCRVIGFQVYAEEGNDYNNFVLDISGMINGYADKMLVTKRKILVSPEQERRTNRYTQIEGQRNAFHLDFPNNSITQGALFFPQKSEALSMSILTSNISSIIQQIKQDNSDIVRYMSAAFRSVGNNMTKFDNLFMQNYGISTTRTPDKILTRNFAVETPGWNMPSEIIVVGNSTNNKLDYHLMLSESEMMELRKFIASLSEREVDFIQRISRMEEQSTPEHDLFKQLDKVTVKDTTALKKGGYYIQTASMRSYPNTGNVRKHLIKTLLGDAGYKETGSDFSMTMSTLAQAQYRIIGCPTSTEFLHQIKIVDLANKKVISDEMLDNLVNYYKSIKSELDKAERFESNGETYYWVDRKLLP